MQKGAVHEAQKAYIFRLVRAKGAKSLQARELVDYIQSEFKSLPFASRWIYNWRNGAEAVFLDLVKNRSIVGYPVLVEESGAVVSQAEHTVLVTEEGCRVLTA